MTGSRLYNQVLGWDFAESKMNFYGSGKKSRKQPVKKWTKLVRNYLKKLDRDECCEDRLS